MRRAALTALVAVATATASNGRGWCGTEPATQEYRSTLRALAAQEKEKRGAANETAAEVIDIPVYIHARVNTTEPDAVLSEQVLQAQFAVLVDRFAPYGISFTLKGTDRLADDTLSKGSDVYDWTGHRVSTRRGGYDTLNIWIASGMDQSVGGSCSLPGEGVTPGSFLALLDGCTLNGYTMPGSMVNGTEYLGEVAVHEVGHWLGLLHTFDGEDCDGEGDSIDDTPAEGSFEFMACPVGKDTCPDQPGLDPIDNFMDYSGDGCWNKFTEGQKQRMHQAWHTMRTI
ncbi:uncharacterized protein B0I36DRAFT_370753 [Microdochium trichocladiopsis]|uniref:Peptidase M43 pregnancy-associated plasma-A domain-containing protein n=1 Tax=Microdochium trichocladiopsis TaxID=1682393 RepID=A0A9P8YG31_9PEZI|nr:uncharacterized protein B0I36DRAFT_370753 [Microdochium trichocladiopsis]KAH7039739.1 hypothetical protein B0I36DRAFT_370753 [Microdochium trichocladiopsis]